MRTQRICLERLPKAQTEVCATWHQELGGTGFSLCCRSTRAAWTQTGPPAPRTAPESDCRTHDTPTKYAPLAESCYRATDRRGPAPERTIPPGSADTDWKNSGIQ